MSKFNRVWVQIEIIGVGFRVEFFRGEIFTRIWLTLLGSISLKELVLNLEYFPLKSLEDNMDMMSTDLVDNLVYQSCLGILVQKLLGRLVVGLLIPEGLHLESFELTLPSFDVVLCEISLDGFETKPKIWLLNGKSENEVMKYLFGVKVPSKPIYSG